MMMDREPQQQIWKQVKKFRVAISVTVFLCIFIAGFMLGHSSKLPEVFASNLPGPNGFKMLKSGPWGELDVIPLTISAPSEILPVQNIENETIHWGFKGMSCKDLAALLNSTDLTQAQRELLLGPSVLHILPDRIDLTPPRELIMSLSPRSRHEIYSRLALFPENWSQIHFFDTASLNDRLKDAGISKETENLFHKLSCDYGENTILSSLSCLLSAIPDYNEKARLLKTLTSQKTMLIRLHLTEKTDINELARYWGKACWSTDVRAMLDSLAHVPGGTWVDIVELLPPLPTALLYTYPVPDNPANGPAISKDCFWTAFNFFRDPPDHRFTGMDFISERLKTDFFPIPDDPRYGDIAFFTTDSGFVVHAAVYIADNVVYTKNGTSKLVPWTLSTIPELEKMYSFAVPPGQKIKVMFYRNKYL